jgi:alkylation response protein AidB-like acyl-CoA dehydrogenase
MAIYHAPVQDWQFLLHDFLGIETYHELPGFADLSADFTLQVLDAAAKFHEEVLHPINLRADAQGARLEDGQVKTPEGYKEAWQAYREAGWHRLSLSQDLGGAGLAPIMGVPISEMRASTGHSFSMYSSFCAPTAHMLAALAPQWVRTHVVPKLSDGEWTATMCMTEPHAGTDLRQLTTRATQQLDGTWRVTGQKIFISGGDHDLTDNIIHIILAKVPDSSGRIPNSLSAVNVFMVSKRRIDLQTGALGGNNGVHVSAIEHKMGIEGSATCALDFEDAVAYHISDVQRTGTSANMAPMFYLMNYARVGTAMSGVGYAEIARQNAANYARERLSGRASPKVRCPEKAADPIIVHADIRRLLLEARAFAEGARAGAMRAALWQSVAQHCTAGEEREHASDMLEVLTPVMKAFFTDRGFEATVACQQVLGGHGYIKDYGIEQYVRNARIGQLYEGANGIQGSDLVHRKLTAHGGRAQRHFVQAVTAFVECHAHEDHLSQFVQPVKLGLARVVTSLDWMQQRAVSEPEGMNAGAYDLLTAIGILYLGWTWADMASVLMNPSKCKTLGDEARSVKLELAKVWMQRQMPLIPGLCDRIESGNESLLSLADDLI